jgi:hypothetical protein
MMVLPLVLFGNYGMLEALKCIVWLFWRVVLGEGAQRAKCHAYYFMHGKVVVIVTVGVTIIRKN